eukprot:7786764-Ditylum_brightwellii.AAC.1
MHRRSLANIFHETQERLWSNPTKCQLALTCQRRGKYFSPSSLPHCFLSLAVDVVHGFAVALLLALGHDVVKF